MKDFKIFRYIQKWRYLIIACMIIGGIGFYYYANQKQTYTSSVRISYTNAAIEEGLLPDGSPLDVSEILSSNVIDGVVADMQSSSTVEGIRSKCKVEPIIPDEERALQASLLEKGEEYVYYPTDYTLSYEADHNASPETARRILSALLDNYLRIYAERYINTSIIPNNASNIEDNTYDYIDQIDIISQSVSDMRYFLKSKMELYPQYRSAQTSYSFSDLYHIYTYIYDNILPYLYSETLNSRISKDPVLTSIAYEESILHLQQSMKNTKIQLQNIDQLIANYNEKIANGTITQSDFETETTDGKPVLQSVYEWDLETTDDERAPVNRKTTYNKLIEQRIAKQFFHNSNQIATNRKMDMLGIFQNAPIASEKTIANIEKKITNLVSDLHHIYTIVTTTTHEFNRGQTMANISIMSNINVKQGINIRIYLVLTILVFFVFGSIGAVVLGRAGDIWEYWLYNDKKTGLPNRARCDMEIARYEGHLLPDHFCCMVISISNLHTLNDVNGYEVGDKALQKVSTVLRTCANSLGFLGYNASGQYLCLFDNCSPERTESLFEEISSQIKIHNQNVPDLPIHLTVGYSNSTSQQIYFIKPLIAHAYHEIAQK